MTWEGAAVATRVPRAGTRGFATVQRWVAPIALAVAWDLGRAAPAWSAPEPLTMPDPRVLGQGGAGVALAGDAAAILWNPALLAFHPDDAPRAPSRRRVTVVVAAQGRVRSEAMTYGEGREYLDAGEPGKVSPKTRDAIWARIQAGQRPRIGVALGGFEGFSVGSIGAGARQEIAFRLEDVSKDAAYFLLYAPRKDAAVGYGPDGQPTCPPFIRPNTTYDVQVRTSERVAAEYPVAYGRMLPVPIEGVRIAAGAALRMQDGGRYESQEAQVRFTTSSSVCDAVPYIERNRLEFVHGANGIGAALDVGLAVELPRGFSAGLAVGDLFSHQRWAAVREVYTWDLDAASQTFLDFLGRSEAFTLVERQPSTLRGGATWTRQRWNLTGAFQGDWTPARRNGHLRLGAEVRLAYGSARAGLAWDGARRTVIASAGFGVRLGRWRRRCSSGRWRVRRCSRRVRAP